MMFPRSSPNNGIKEPFNPATNSPGIIQYFSLPKNEDNFISAF